MLWVRGEGEDPWVEGTVRRTGLAKGARAGIRAPEGCQTDVERGIHPSFLRLHPLMKERKSILLNNLLSTNDSLPSTSDSTRFPKTNAKSRTIVPEARLLLRWPQSLSPIMPSTGKQRAQSRQWLQGVRPKPRRHPPCRNSP